MTEDKPVPKPRLFYELATRNDPCPCLSGLKYKKCCETAFRKALSVIRIKDARIKELLIEVLAERLLHNARTTRKVLSGNKATGSVIIYSLNEIPALKVNYGSLPITLHSKQDIEIVSRVKLEDIIFEKLKGSDNLAEVEPKNNSLQTDKIEVN